MSAVVLDTLGRRVDHLTQEAQFVHYQGLASTTWVINHNLDKYPNVLLIESTGERFYGKEVHINRNQVIIEFQGECTGTAYLS